MRRNWLSLLCVFTLIYTVGVLAQTSLPTPADLDEGINYLTIDGATCARGTPYTFAARHANPEKLMIYFQGGGACWNLSTCRVGGPFDDSTEVGELDIYDGIFNFDNPENPLLDYSMVIVTYCTGDVHTGEGSVTFGEGDSAVDIIFNGVANTNAVLAWAYENYPNPANLLITGSSAGAYGAIYHAPTILQAYPDARAVVIGDAGLGITQEGWTGLETWNITANLPDESEFRVVNETRFTNDLYLNAAAMFPDVTFAEYSSAADQVQIGFYFLQGGAPLDWVRISSERLEELNALDNFRSYLAWGDTHTIFPLPLFYTMQVNGVRFLDWFNNLLNAETVETIQCEDCRAEELYQP